MRQMVGITFGICTYNRKEILEYSAKSLSCINDLDKINIRIYDDCSTDYDEKYLKELFPTAISIVRSNKNSGADKNTSCMYEDFLKSGDEWLFNADSDLIYRCDIVHQIQKYIDESNEFITFFNCINHNTICVNESTVEKDSVGAAGCLLSRKVVSMILNGIKYRDVGFDVRFSRLLQKNGVRLLATKESIVQHIGVTGYNSRDFMFDYGEGFVVTSKENAEIIEKTFEKYVAAVRQYKDKTEWKMYNFVVSIPRRTRKIIRIIRAGIFHE